MQASGAGDARTKGLGSDELRHHNLGAVLEILHLEGPTARSELTARTGLNRSTIGRLIAELSAAELVTEGAAPKQSGPGRPSHIVAAHPSKAPALAVEITIDTITAALIGMGGTILARAEISGDWTAASPEEAAFEVGCLVGPLAEDMAGSIVGACVAVPGIVRQEDGFLHFAPNLGWSDVVLAELIGAQLPHPLQVMVGNEANLGAFAEHRRNLPDVRDLVYVHADVGIGLGIISNGQQLTGSRGYASEGGHMTVRHDGAACRCGATGCWETEVGEEALLRHTFGEEHKPGRVAVEALAKRLTDGDERSLAGVAEVGHWLGVGIADLANLLNPEVVVLGGIYTTLFEWLEDSLSDSLEARALDVTRDGLRVIPSALGPDAPLMGAAEAVLSEAIARPERFLSLERGAR